MKAIAVREARAAELALLPPLEIASGELFGQLGIGPFADAGSVEDLAAALAVLVAGDPPEGFARIDHLRTADGTVVRPDCAHLEQLSVHPDHGRRGIGRALVRASVEWATDHGYDELSLATYRDVPWNGPFYASEGFVEVAPVDAWYAAHGLEPEPPVVQLGGVRVLMSRRLRP